MIDNIRDVKTLFLLIEIFITVTVLWVGIDLRNPHTDQLSVSNVRVEFSLIFLTSVYSVI